MNTEKGLARIMEEIEKQGLETTDEINEFLKSMQGKSLDDLPKRTDKKGRSQDLVYEAYEHSNSKGKKLVKQALELDPNNTEAYNYLASIEKDIDKAIAFYEKAIKAGEKTLGKNFFEEHKGYFWGMIETRPYMRAKAGLADCLYAKKEIDKSIDIYEEMLELNPNDNQGIRYLLSTLLLGNNDLDKFQSFMDESEEEDCAVWNYNNALFHFKKFGKTKKSEKELLNAYESNPHVVEYMLGIKELPDELPEFIGIGDENEAISYVNEVWLIWKDTDNAFDWLYEFRQKRMKIN